MSQNRQADLLRGELETILSSLDKSTDLIKMAKEPLSIKRRGLSDNLDTDQPWPLLPLIICEAVSGHYEQALPAAAALQLLLAAGDVFDDIEDADSPESLSSKYGIALATNTATTLLILAENALTRLKKYGLKDDKVIRVIESVNSFYTTACTGQHLDISLGSFKDLPEQEYLKIVEMKSASQIACACHTGALIATDNQYLIDQFSQFGHNLGMAAQISNDIRGVIRGNDIMKRKLSLPVVFALSQIEGEIKLQLETIYIKGSDTPVDQEIIRDALFHTGSIYYATLKMEFYKQVALDTLADIDLHGVDTQNLKLFLK